MKSSSFSSALQIQHKLLLLIDKITLLLLLVILSLSL
jgi:hypothetical protein